MPLLVDLFGVCMQLYEIVLSILGIVLFIAAIVFTALKYDTKLLVVMFLISLVMIGFPAITKVAFAEVTIEVQRLQCLNDKLAESPADSSLRTEAKEMVEKIKKEGDATANVTTVITLAQTNALLGDSVKAVEWANKGLEVLGNNEELQQFKSAVLTPRVQAEIQLRKLEANPADTAAEAALQQQVKILEASPVQYAEVYITLSKAKAVLGDTAKAAAKIDSALKLEPQNREARKLRDVYRSNSTRVRLQ